MLFNKNDEAEPVIGKLTHARKNHVTDRTRVQANSGYELIAGTADNNDSKLL